MKRAERQAIAQSLLAAAEALEKSYGAKTPAGFWDDIATDETGTPSKMTFRALSVNRDKSESPSLKTAIGLEKTAEGLAISVTVRGVKQTAVLHPIQHKLFLKSLRSLLSGGMDDIG